MQASGWKFSDQAEEERLRSILKELALDKRNTFFLVDVGSEDAVNYSIVNLYSRNKILVTEQPVEIVAELYNFSSNPSPQKRVQF
jgi:hypothetical protein